MSDNIHTFKHQSKSGQIFELKVDLTTDEVRITTETLLVKTPGVIEEFEVFVQEVVANTFEFLNKKQLHYCVKKGIAIHAKHKPK